MTGYTKLFGSITRSTVWELPHHVRIVWITMLAVCDRDGVVEGSVPGLAHEARVGVDECKQALALLGAPDPFSRTTEHEGRRIEPVDGGWRVLNHGKYRDKMDAAERRERDAERQRRKRERDRAKQAVTQSHAAHEERHVISQTSREVAHAEAEASPDTTQIQRESEPRAPAYVASPAPTYRDLVGHAPPRTEYRAEPERTPSQRALIRGYRERMDLRGKVWVTVPDQHVAACAAAIDAQVKATGADVETVASAWLDRAFGDAEMLARVKADVPPWGVLAKRPEQWLTGEAAVTPQRKRLDELRGLVLEGHILTDEQRAEANELAGRTAAGDPLTAALWRGSRRPPQ